MRRARATSRRSGVAPGGGYNPLTEDLMLNFDGGVDLYGDGRSGCGGAGVVEGIHTAQQGSLPIELAEGSGVSRLNDFHTLEC